MMCGDSGLRSDHTKAEYEGRKQKSKWMKRALKLGSLREPVWRARQQAIDQTRAAKEAVRAEETRAQDMKAAHVQFLQFVENTLVEDFLDLDGHLALAQMHPNF